MSRLEILRNAPRDAWIALNEAETEMVGSAPTFSEVVEVAQKKGVAEPVIIRTPKDWLPLAL